MFCPVEAEEVAHPPDVNHLRYQRCPLGRVFNLSDFELVPPTAIGEHLSGNSFGRKGFGCLFQSVQGRSSNQQHIIDDMKHPHRALF